MKAHAKASHPDAQAANDLFQNEILDGFVIMSHESLVIFIYNATRNEFKPNVIRYDEAWKHTRTIPVSAICLIADYKNAFFKQGSSEEVVN
jgi:hypothetical protein